MRGLVATVARWFAPDARLLGTVARIEPSCIVEPDDSAVVRHAAPLDDRARDAMREQQIARLVRDHAAITAREAADVQRRRASFRLVAR